MCGRTACTLHPDRLQMACSYQPRAAVQKKDGGGGKYQRAGWTNHPGTGRTYQSSANMAPTSFCPVLVRGQHVQLGDSSAPAAAAEEAEGTTTETDSKATEAERALMPMRWGLIPFFHKGTISDMKLTTFNARSEEFMSKNMFSVPFKKGRRCVVVCDGYYEWKREGGAKKPYFFYRQQPDGVDLVSAEVNTRDESELWDEQAGWRGPRLTTMAGVFDVWRSADGDVLYSYTVLTQPSDQRLSWIHDRMPVFLDSEAAISDWLADDQVPAEDALKLIAPRDALVWHPVSPEVNNIRNNEVSYAPYQEPKKNTASAGFMAAWLKKGEKGSAAESDKATKDEEKTKHLEQKKGEKRSAVDSEQDTVENKKQKDSE